MSKELEALSYLVETAIYGNKENNRGKIFEAENTIKQTLKRNEPMKPQNMEFDYGEPSTGICNCGYQVNSSERYCSSCGQKLDWGNDDE